MKKHFIVLIAATMIGGAFTSCSKEKSPDCTSASKTVSDAASAYSQNQSSANCKNYKTALQNYLSSDCASGISAEEKAAFQDAVNSLTCPE